MVVVKGRIVRDHALHLLATKGVVRTHALHLPVVKGWVRNRDLPLPVMVKKHALHLPAKVKNHAPGTPLAGGIVGVVPCTRAAAAATTVAGGVGAGVVLLVRHPLLQERVGIIAKGVVLLLPERAGITNKNRDSERMKRKQGPRRSLHLDRDRRHLLGVIKRKGGEEGENVVLRIRVIVEAGVAVLAVMVVVVKGGINLRGQFTVGMI